MREIVKLQKTMPVIKKRKRVAAYARVSIEKGRTIHSLSAQVSFYNSFIQNNDEWEFAGVYADKGISGTSTEARTEFKKMIEDCEKGKIDIILTKSISRFARNTVDLLNTVRHLKELGIEVRFEKENIYSLSGDGELMLTILASFAQEEITSLSNNVKWSIQKDFKKGKTNSHCIYGYRWNGDNFEVVQEEAEVVKLIFNNFVNGMSAEETEKQLEKMKIKSYTGCHFGNKSIRAILRNEKYTGNMILQKEYVPIPGHRTKKNLGELPQYYVENSHEAIIDKETFDWVQEEIARRRALGVFANKSIKTNCFTSKIKCNKCGKSYQKTSRFTGKDRHRYAIWMCASRKKSGNKGCCAKDVPENQLKRVCSEVLEIDEFDEAVFKEKVNQIEIIGTDTMKFYFNNGNEIIKTWKSTARIEVWSEQRRREWGIFQKGNKNAKLKIKKD